MEFLQNYIVYVFALKSMLENDAGKLAMCNVLPVALLWLVTMSMERDSINWAKGKAPLMKTHFCQDNIRRGNPGIYFESLTTQSRDSIYHLQV